MLLAAIVREQANQRLQAKADDERMTPEDALAHHKSQYVATIRGIVDEIEEVAKVINAYEDEKEKAKPQAAYKIPIKGM